MLLGSLSFAARDWIWPALALFAIGLILAWVSYSQSPLRPLLRFSCFLLRACGLALLLLFLLEPTWTTTRPREGANLFAIVADNSMGLQLRDNGAPLTRAEILREHLTKSQTSWQAIMAQTFLVRQYLFDARLHPSEEFSELDFQGRATALGLSLENLRERFQGQPLAGVLLFTDGNATDLEGGLPDLAGFPPVYPVLIGQEEPLRDVAVDQVSFTQTVFEDAPVTLTSALKVSGYENQKIRVTVRSEGKLLASQTVQPSSGGRAQVSFQLKPEQAGVSFYEVVAEPEKADSNPEATAHNNSRLVAIDRGQGPHRILYVSGRPNWEFKYLNRALAEDPQVQLVALIRIARREAKFTFRGRTGESSNPLFRGFNKVDEETERYDQPVIIRLNTRDETELRSGFPKVPEDLFGFKAVILDDVEADFFTPDQMLLLQRFVSERGGGFLMLGGSDSLQDGKYARTPIGDMLPFYLDRLPEPAQSVNGLRLDLTREGWLEPWIRVRQNQDEERLRLQAMPSFRVLNQLKEVKPGAVLLASATSAVGKKFPAVAMQRYGHGRTAAITLGDLWRAGLAEQRTQEDLAKSWRQLARWLISDVPTQVELRVQPSPSDGDGAVRLLVKARDKDFQPLENATVEMTVQAPGVSKTNLIKLRAEPSDDGAGLYQALYLARVPGAYRVSASVMDSSGMNVANVNAGWTSEPLAREFSSLTPNRSLMEELARATGGEVVSPDELESFVGRLKKMKVPIVETYSYPLWHRSWAFLLALGCFATEWGLRRVKGLA